MCPITVVVQLLSLVRLFATPWTAAGQASLSFTISWSLLRLMCTELVNVSESKLLYTSVKDRCGTRGRNSEFLWLFRNESVNVTKHITKKDVEGKPK